MKHLLYFIFGISILAGCKETSVEKPNNLIAEDQMVNIITDFTLLESIKGNDPSAMGQKQIDPHYVYKKYKIDSLQFAKSDRYYASDVKRYAALYDRVSKKLEALKKRADQDLKDHPEPVKTQEEINAAVIEKARSQKTLSPEYQKTLRK